jgi:hypothetical protein
MSLAVTKFVDKGAEGTFLHRFQKVSILEKGCLPPEEKVSYKINFSP